MLNESSVIRWNWTQSNRKVNEWLDRSVTFFARVFRRRKLAEKEAEWSGQK